MRSPTGDERRNYLTEALQSVIPNVVYGVFRLAERDLQRVPEAALAAMTPLAGWWVLVFAVPITDDGLWVWHKHGEHRSLMANYVLARARAEVERVGATHDDRIISISETTDNQVSMVEIGEMGGLGTRGWNNLLLHPQYGSWLQIEAVAVAAEVTVDPTTSFPADVCIQCMNCINDCPANALTAVSFTAPPCAKLVAAPMNPRSKAIALTADSYIECRECISSCPIGEAPEGIFAWRR